MIQKYDEFVNEGWKNTIATALLGLGLLTTACKKDEPAAVYKFQYELSGKLVSDMWAFKDKLTTEEENKVEEYAEDIQSKHWSRPINGKLTFVGYDDAYNPSNLKDLLNDEKFN